MPVPLQFGTWGSEVHGRVFSLLLGEAMGKLSSLLWEQSNDLLFRHISFHRTADVRWLGHGLSCQLEQKSCGGEVDYDVPIQETCADAAVGCTCVTWQCSYDFIFREGFDSFVQNMSTTIDIDMSLSIQMISRQSLLQNQWRHSQLWDLSGMFLLLSEDTQYETKCTDSSGYSWCTPKFEACPIECAEDQQAAVELLLLNFVNVFWINTIPTYSNHSHLEFWLLCYWDRCALKPPGLLYHAILSQWGSGFHQACGTAAWWNPPERAQLAPIFQGGHSVSTTPEFPQKITGHFEMKPEQIFQKFKMGKNQHFQTKWRTKGMGKMNTAPVGKPVSSMFLIYKLKDDYGANTFRQAQVPGSCSLSLRSCVSMTSTCPCNTEFEDWRVLVRGTNSLPKNATFPRIIL